jgi:hypothetical protein
LRDTLRSYDDDVTYIELPWADRAFEEVPTGFLDRVFGKKPG